MSHAAAVNPPAPPPAAPTAAPAVDVRGVSHRYPRSSRAALDGVSLSVAAGEVFGLLGPNGSGKTTLFSLLATMRRPQAGPGMLRVMGRDAVTEPAAVRRELGVVFQHPSLDPKLTAEENLIHAGHLYGLRGADLRERIDRGLDRFGLADRRRDMVETFSGGMRRRLELAKALLHGPRLLLMDEPSTGLDPAARRDLWRHVLDLRDRARGGLTVLLTTHLMDEAERCDRLAVMSGGRVVARDTPEALKARVGGDVVTLTPAARLDAGDRLDDLIRRIAERFAPFPAGGEPTASDGRIRFELPADRDASAAVHALLTAWPGRIQSVTVGRPTLEDAYLHLTGAALDGGGIDPAPR